MWCTLHIPSGLTPWLKVPVRTFSRVTPHTAVVTVASPTIKKNERASGLIRFSPHCTHDLLQLELTYKYMYV